MGSAVRIPPGGALLRPLAGADPSWHPPSASSSRQGRGQSPPASSNGPNGRTEPPAEEQGAEPGAGAHLRTRPPAPRRRPPQAALAPPPSSGRARHNPRGRRGAVLTVTAPESGGEAPLAVLDRLSQPRGPAQAPRHAAPRAGGPASASGSRFPRPRPDSAPPLAATPSLGRFARFPPRPRAAGAAGSAASHWFLRLLGDEQPRPALAPRSLLHPLQKNLEKKKTLSLEPERDAGAAAAAAPVTACDSPGPCSPPPPYARWVGAPGHRGGSGSWLLQGTCSEPQ